MLWRLPEDTDLAVYFGRCVGAFVLLVELMMFRAAAGSNIEFVFETLIALWLLMIIVHVWGWVRGIQPITETLEILFWILLLVLTIACWPGAELPYGI